MLINFLLDLRYRERKITKAVDHVDLKVEEGEILVLVGSNGARKTTLIKMLCTLFAPDEGRATICGHDLITEYREIRRLVSLVTAGGWVAFDSLLSVKENLQFFTRLYGLSHDEAVMRVEEVLRMLELKDVEPISIRSIGLILPQTYALKAGRLALIGGYGLA